MNRLCSVSMEKMVELAQHSDTADWLSRLPDDILICKILPRSFSTMKEAARTSILSRRWRSLWSYFPSLDFDATVTIARDLDFNEKILSPKAPEYVSWVNSVISAHRGRLDKLCRFQVQFFLDGTFSRDIDSWLMFSLAKGVEVLVLDLCWHSPRGMYTLPSLIEPSHFPNLRLLRSLILKYVVVTPEALEHLLLGCESLEKLRLDYLIDINQANVTSPFPEATRLVSLKCEFLHPCSLYVEHAPDLADTPIFQRMCSKGSAVLDRMWPRIFCYFSRLKKLHLYLWDWSKVIVQLPHLPDLSGLKHLGLRLGSSCGIEEWLFVYSSLIKAAPNLRCLTLDLLNVPPAARRLRMEESARLYHLPHLLVLEFACFAWTEVDEWLVQYLLEGALSVKRLILDDRQSETRGFSRRSSSVEWAGGAAKRLLQKLQSGMDLVRFSESEEIIVYRRCGELMIESPL